MPLLMTAGVPEILPDLFPNLPNFIAHVLATIVIVVLLAKWVYKPFRNSIDNRRAKINELLDDAVEKQTQANKDKKAASVLLTNAKTQSSTILKNARADADAQKIKILDEASAEASNIQTQAKNSIAKAQSEAEANIKQAIIDVAFQAAQEILQENVSTDKNKKLVEDYLKELDSTKGLI
ncbi:F0F1 ATP synthase subunit B [Mesoplasma lactucae]|uniref:ATP synthase subunit b n=1 Tax=Mesoplasma lactucae ATCC 49193 TaxID=81460 RepID=A0A291ISB8_9MOLU|nr:F0F1 ATP synthase subunit B [Mesoplasma lactucae]ATG97653.1 ATP synthase F0 subunit B [Mesoplasma lactucae ATCC 49193]ATZ19884.1 F0F1 ATP synthase subunit B [Mesoplasma lactucae ATCC 49193]MCL8216747.1 ATP synthase subunit b [Mesoplasma lactucae ATCC 49193]